jgi:hypothetical protein
MGLVSMLVSLTLDGDSREKLHQLTPVGRLCRSGWQTKEKLEQVGRDVVERVGEPLRPMPADYESTAGKEAAVIGAGSSFLTGSLPAAGWSRSFSCTRSLECALSEGNRSGGVSRGGAA